MGKTLCATAVAVAVFCMPSAAFAFGGGGGSRIVPAGDALAQTPPIDVTPQQLQAAPPQFRTREKIQQLRHSRGVDPSLFPLNPY